MFSLMYSKKSIGPRTEPCGTPDVTSVVFDRAPVTETRCLRFDRKKGDPIVCVTSVTVIPYEVSLDTAVEGVYVRLYQRLWQNLY